VPGRRRGARSGRGWDAAPPRPRAAKAAPSGPDEPEPGWASPEAPLWSGEEERYRPADPSPRRASSAREREAVEPEERDPGEVAREICLRQLAVRPRTRVELASALRKKGISDEVAAEVLDRYDEVGLIDDAAFARAWVNSRHHGRGLARRALAGELRQRGVDSELVGAALEEVDGETEAATAQALVDRKLRVMSSGSPDAVFRRLVGLLARKGYPPGLAVNVVKAALAARDEESAAFAELVDPDSLIDLVGEPDDPIR
jgi:regulatory protein